MVDYFDDNRFECDGNQPFDFDELVLKNDILRQN